jgi:hypothetical protein
MKKLLYIYYYFTIFALILVLSSPLSVEAKKQKTLKRLDAAAPITNLTLPALNVTQRQALLEIRPDPKPEEIVRNSHYWVSNEHNHQLWRPYIQDIGGVFVGVGTDQNYLLAGWAKSTFLILMDFDEQIPNLHQIYAYFISISDTPKMLVDRWSRTYGEDSAQKLKEHFTPIANELAQKEAASKGLSGDKSVRYINRRVKRYVRRRVKIFKRTRGLLWRRLTKTRDKYATLKIPTFLDDQAQYDHIRSLWVSGRVLAIRGDLTADLSMLDIAKAIQALGETLNVLYLSNAEQYFPLTPKYRRNIIEQPWGEKSYAIRTMAWGSLGFYDDKEEYHYNVQTGENFITWMQKSRTTKAGRMLFKGRKLIINPGFSEMTKLPVKSKRLPKIAKQPTIR